MALNYETEDVYRATMGAIVLKTDETLEPELSRAKPGDVALYHSRIPFDLVVTAETLGRMEANLPASLNLLPDQPHFDVIGYGCTSGSVVIGPDRISEIIQAHYPGAAATNPISAVMDACRALECRKIGLVTPYSLAVSQKMIDLLVSEGFEIAKFASFEEERDQMVARMSERTTLEAILEVGADDDVEIVFASCTNLRAFGIIEEAEAKLGKPVISSNLALSWRMLRLAGIKDATGPGRLFQL